MTWMHSLVNEISPWYRQRILFRLLNVEVFVHNALLSAEAL